MKEIERKLVSCCVVTLAVVLMFVQSSCVSRRMLSEQVVVHDTLRVFHTDTVRHDIHHSHTDTVRESRVEVITLRQDSARTDTVRVETILERWHSVFVTDSVHVFRHLADSLQAALNRQAVREVSVSRRHRMGRFSLDALLFAMVVVMAWILLKRRTR